MNWIVGSGDIQGASFGKGVWKKLIWEPGTVPEEVPFNVGREDVSVDRMTPAVSGVRGKTIHHGIITKIRFSSMFLPIFHPSPHSPDRFWSNLVPIES